MPFILIFFLLNDPLFAQVTERVLSNGLKVVVAEDRKSPLAVFQIWYRVGSRDEVSGKTGVSHLLEHMMFKGTSNYGPSELSKTIQKYGGTDNAFTSSDYTVYWEKLPSDRIDLSFRFESDRMRNLLMDEKETLSERDVVMEERRLRYEDDPENSLYEEVIAAAFKVHSYQWPVIGWMPDIKGIGREDLYEHYRRYYSPDNALIVVAGDIGPDEMLKKAEEYFGDIQPGLPRENQKNVSEEPPQRGPRRVYLKKEAELPQVIAAYHVPNQPHPDAYALDVLVGVLSGKSGRLYKSLVYEKKLALGAYADYSGMHRDPNLFLLGGTSTPGTDIDALEEALYAEMERIKNEPPSEKEVTKAKNQIEASFIMGQDSIYYQAMLIGQYEMLGGWRLKDGYVNEIRKVTPADVQRAASKYLHEDNRTTGILVPVKK